MYFNVWIIIDFKLRENLWPFSKWSNLVIFTSAIDHQIHNRRMQLNKCIHVKIIQIKHSIGQFHSITMTTLIYPFILLIDRQNTFLHSNHEINFEKSNEKVIMRCTTRNNEKWTAVKHDAHDLWTIVLTVNEISTKMIDDILNSVYIIHAYSRF